MNKKPMDPRKLLADMARNLRTPGKVGDGAERVLEVVADTVDRHAVVVPEMRIQRGRTVVTLTGRVDRPPDPFCDDGALVTATRRLLRELTTAEKLTPSAQELIARLTRYLETGRWNTLVTTPVTTTKEPTP